MQEEKSSSDSFRDEVEKMTTIEQLAQAARGIKDESKNGSGSKEHEDIVIDAILPKIGSATEAIEFSKNFDTVTGTHRLLLSYVEKNGVTSEDDAKTLLGGIYMTSFHGKELMDAIISAAKTAGVESDNLRNIIDKHTLELIARSLRGIPGVELTVTRGIRPDPNNPSLKGLSGIIISGSAFPDSDVEFGTGEAMKKPCDCLNCQIERLSQESPENSHIPEQWKSFKELLIGKGLLKITNDGNMLVHDPDEVKKEVEKFGLDERLMSLLMSALDKPVPSAIREVLKSDFLRALMEASRRKSIVGVKKAFRSPEEIDGFLSERQQAGQLDHVGFPFEDQIYSLKDLIEQKRDEIPPGVVEVLEKYAALQNSEKPATDAG